LSSIEANRTRIYHSSIAVPDAHLGLIGYREAEFREHASRIAHELPQFVADSSLEGTGFEPSEQKLDR
jgi:hypothetical protein